MIQCFLVVVKNWTNWQLLITESDINLEEFEGRIPNPLPAKYQHSQSGVECGRKRLIPSINRRIGMRGAPKTTRSRTKRHCFRLPHERQICRCCPRANLTFARQRHLVDRSPVLPRSVSMDVFVIDLGETRRGCFELMDWSRTEQLTSLNEVFFKHARHLKWFKIVLPESWAASKASKPLKSRIKKKKKNKRKFRGTLGRRWKCASVRRLRQYTRLPIKNES